MTRKTLGGARQPVHVTNESTEAIPVTTPVTSPLAITQIGTGGVDAFARQRMTQPATIFDSKQVFDFGLGAGNENQPLFWDNQQTSGSGTSTAYSNNTASTTLIVGTAAGTRVRQTRRRFNYLPGKSMLAIMTFSGMGSDTGITKRIGLFDEKNGLFLQHSNGVASVCQRSYATGAAVDTVITQNNWNLDTMDGNGPSGITIDFNKTQIFFFDYEWLGVGRVRLGFFLDGIPYYVHQFLNTNNLYVAYMSTPNLPVRAEISNDGTGGITTFSVICCSVISEGGQDLTGMHRTIAPSTWATNIINANTVGTTYAIAGIRLKAGSHLAATVDISSVVSLATTTDEYILSLHFNPTLSAAASWSDVAESSIQYALGATTNPGTSLTSPGYTMNSNLVDVNLQAAQVSVINSIKLGSKIDGTPDEIWLCATPLSINLDILGAINWHELL